MYPDNYYLIDGVGMGYLLEEHFVTLWRVWDKRFSGSRTVQKVYGRLEIGLWLFEIRYFLIVVCVGGHGKDPEFKAGAHIGAPLREQY